MNAPFRNPPPIDAPGKPPRNLKLFIRLWMMVAGLSVAGCAGTPQKVSDSHVRCAGNQCNTAYESLAMPNAAWSTGDVEGLSSARRTIVVTTRWKGRTPALRKPRGAAGRVASKLGSSAVIGGAILLAGDPFRAAVWGAALAIGGVIEGVGTGRAARGIHRELDVHFSPTGFGGRVREALEHGLTESGARPLPRVSRSRSVAAGDSARTPNTIIELTFEKAALQSSRRAWQFHPDNTPELVLVIKARARILRDGEKRPMLDQEVEYKGRRVLDGRAKAFQTEVQHAADYIAKTVLRRFANAKSFPDGEAPPPTEALDTLTPTTDPARRDARITRGSAPGGSM